MGLTVVAFAAVVSADVASSASNGNAVNVAPDGSTEVGVELFNVGDGVTEGGATLAPRAAESAAGR